jgi:hypothetical protein
VDGVQRIDISGGRPHRVWTAAASVTGSPVVGGGTYGRWTPKPAPCTPSPHPLASTTASRHIGPVSRFAFPTLAGSLVLVPILQGVTAVRVK